MTEAKEVLKHEPPVLVAILGNRLGHEIKKPGASFSLSNVYDHEPMAGNDVFTQVYFRTESGNIYRVDDKGNLTDAKESQRRGAVAQTSLELEDLKGQKLIIGEPFYYGSSGKKGNTSKVTEIVPVVEHRTYIPDALRQITNGRTNTIKEDFQKLLPPQKIGARNNRDLEGLVGPEDLEDLIRIKTGNPPREKKPQVTPPPAVNLGEEKTQTKGNEASEGNLKPKTIQEVRNVQDKELEQKAAELARETKRKGMGYIFGKFPPRVSPPNTVGGFTHTGFFIQGEDIPYIDPATRMLIWGHFGTAIYPIKTGAMSGIQPNVGRPIWNTRNYVPTKDRKREVQTLERKEKKWLGLRTEIVKEQKVVRVPTDTLTNYHGKHGESDWIRYEYATGLFNYPYDSRPAFVMMTVVVPPDLAVQIDEQVEKNVYFPDAFFQAIYPGYVGQDTHKDIRRKPAKELEIINDRTGVKKVVQYPHPIPY
jgi:hypothetical protein